MAEMYWLVRIRQITVALNGVGRDVSEAGWLWAWTPERMRHDAEMHLAWLESCA